MRSTSSRAAFLPLLLLLLFPCLFSVCLAEAPAEEITDLALITAGSGQRRLHYATDGDYRSRWEGSAGEDGYLQVDLEGGEACGAVWLQWYGESHPWQVQAEIRGEWQTLVSSDTGYFSDVLVLPLPMTHFRIRTADGGDSVMPVAELRLFSPGPLPESVQVWRPTVEKASLMLIACHPDDEVLWFGGTLATYAGELGMDVLVCTLSPSAAWRKLELLDCLWTCGVRTYPVWGDMIDIKTQSLQAQYRIWDKDTLQELFTLWYRKYRPEVVLTHDIRGEYGHGGHRVCADMAIGALEWASDPNMFPESKAKWGLWDVPKLYLHLYRENRVTLRWDRPLEAFGGKSGLEVAREAFLCHKSQQTGFAVRDSGPYSCTEFGLYRSLVGPDIRGNDFYENLPFSECFEVTE